MKLLRFAAVAAVAALALTACASGNGDTGGDTKATDTAATDTESAAPTEAATSDAAPEPANITLWLAGGDTNDDLRAWLKKTFEEQNPGSTLTIQEQDWGNLITSLTTALPDPNNTPDVTEIGNTQSPTFTTVGAFLDITDLVPELGGSDLVQSFVAAGSVGDKVYAVPYYFGSRIIFYRPDIYKAGKQEVPTKLADVATVGAALKTDKMSGFAMGGQDWRNGISWIFAYGGEMATQGSDGKWTSTMSDAKSVEGLKAWQDLYTKASNLPSSERDVAYWDFLNDKTKGKNDPDAATIMSPGWARWSIGEMTKNDAGDEVRDGMADSSKFDVYGLPGVDGDLAPVFAGGSNIGISAKSQHPELAKNLMRIIFSADYQKMLAAQGMGPGNLTYAPDMYEGKETDDPVGFKINKLLVDTAAISKLTPAAPGFAAIEAAFTYEEMFQEIADGGDVATVAAKYDQKLTPMLNGGAS